MYVYRSYVYQCIGSPHPIRVMLDVPHVLVSEDITCVGVVRSLKLPVRSLSVAAVSVVVHVDGFMVDGLACDVTECSPFFVAEQSFLLNVSSCHDVQVSFSLLFAVSG